MDRAFLLLLLVGSCVSLFPFPGHWGYDIDVIEDVPSGVCSSPWFTLSGQCFLAVTEWSEHRTWSEARRYCSQQTQRGDLATPTPHNIGALADYLNTNYARRLGRQWYWLGGSDLVTEGVWTWVNGGGNITTGWDWDEPRNRWGGYEPDYFGGDWDCLGMYSGNGDKSLANVSCGGTRAFVCMAQPS